MNRVQLPGTWSTSEVPEVAVFLCPGAVLLHTGLFYRDAQGLRRLHLAFHHKLTVDEPDLEDDAWLNPALDPLHLAQVATRCRQLENERPAVPYAFRYEYTRLDDRGKLVLGSGEYGLTCASFVLAVFASVGLNLVDISSWQPRAGDATAMAQLAAMLRRHGFPEQAEKVETEVGESVVRFRPEEVAVVTLSDGGRPVPFGLAECSGGALLAHLGEAGVIASQ